MILYAFNINTIIVHMEKICKRNSYYHWDESMNMCNLSTDNLIF